VAADNFWARHLAADYEQEIQGGWGNDAELQRVADEIAEANRIANLDMYQCAAERKRLGLRKDLASFLSGN
jgi:hypothetical protein